MQLHVWNNVKYSNINIMFDMIAYKSIFICKISQFSVLLVAPYIPRLYITTSVHKCGLNFERNDRHKSNIILIAGIKLICSYTCSTIRICKWFKRTFTHWQRQAVPASFIIPSKNKICLVAKSDMYFFVLPIIMAVLNYSAITPPPHFLIVYIYKINHF